LIIRNFILLILFLALLLTSGCTFLHKKHSVEMEFLPDHINNIQIGMDHRQAQPHLNWWVSFEDTLLNGFMDTAFASSYDIAQAIARLDQSRAKFSASRSTWFPSLSGNIGYQNSDITGSNDSKIPNQSNESYSVNLTAVYELDFWGKISATRQAAYSDLIASKSDYYSFKLIFSAQVARIYFRIIELQQQVTLIENTMVSLTDYLNLVTSRYAAGIVSSLEVYQAESNLARARATKQTVESTYLTSKNSFYNLLGKYPKSVFPFESILLSESLPTVRAEIPSDLLTRRPDIRSAFNRMESADKRWAAVVADRLPSIMLTSQYGAMNSSLSQTLRPDDLIWSAIGNIAMPIFEGGRRKASADQSAAMYRELAARYQAVVLNSFREVENALIIIEKQGQYLEELKLQVAATKNSLRAATDRYLRGLSQYLVLVTAQTAYYNAETDLINARRGLMDAYISLFISLGGNWTDEDLDEK